MIFVTHCDATENRCKACDGQLEPMVTIMLTPAEARFGFFLRLCCACREELTMLLRKMA